MYDLRVSPSVIGLFIWAFLCNMEEMSIRLVYICRFVSPMDSIMEKSLYLFWETMKGEIKEQPVYDSYKKQMSAWGRMLIFSPAIKAFTISHYIHIERRSVPYGDVTRCWEKAFCGDLPLTRTHKNVSFFCSDTPHHTCQCCSSGQACSLKMNCRELMLVWKQV